MKQGKAANPQEVERWIREYGNEILRIAYLYVKDYQIAEDVFQEVFLKACQGFQGFREESSVKTWLIRITINTCKDYLKSAWKRHVERMSEETEQIPAGTDTYEQVEKRLDLRAVEQAVHSLPEPYKDVILCCFYRELSLEETAKQLCLPVGTVKSRLSRAKEKLKQLMKGGNAFDE